MTCSSPVNPQIQGQPVPDRRLTFRDQRRLVRKPTRKRNGGFCESMQHVSVMRAFAPRLRGYLSGSGWKLLLWRNGLPGCRSRGLSGGVR
jgi:hypothetical protein